MPVGSGRLRAFVSSGIAGHAASHADGSDHRPYLEPDRMVFTFMPSCTLNDFRNGMKRTRIQLTEEQARALKAQARMEERSMAELVRGYVAEYLARRRTPDVRELARRARVLKGRFHSGSPDLAEAHDRYLDDAFDP